MPTDDDRRYVAKMLRKFADDYEEGSPAHVLCCDLADLIEPTDETCELEQLKAKLGAVSRIADKYHEKASTILSGWGDKPMGGTDLGRFHAFEQMVGEIREVLG